MTRGSLAAWLLHEEPAAGIREVNFQPAHQFFPRLKGHGLQSRISATSLVSVGDGHLDRGATQFEKLFVKVDDSDLIRGPPQTRHHAAPSSRHAPQASSFNSYPSQGGPPPPPNGYQQGGYQQQGYPPQGGYQQLPPGQPAPGQYQQGGYQQGPPGQYPPPQGAQGPPPPPGQYPPGQPPPDQHDPNGSHDSNAEEGEHKPDEPETAASKGNGGKVGALLAGSTLPISVAVGGAAVYFLFCRKKPQTDLGGDSASEMSDSDEGSDGSKS